MVPGLTADMFDGRIDLGATAESTAPNFTTDEEYFPVTLDKNKLPPCLQDIPEMFPALWSIRCSGDNRYGKLHSPISSFLNTPLPKNVDPTSASTISKRLKVSDLLMTLEELVENEYVLHTSQLAQWRELKNLPETDEDRKALEQRAIEGWVETDLSKTVQEDNQFGSVTEGKTILSIDCEMCRTEAGYELTRISILNWDNEVVYDTLVKPTNPIVDYVTTYSGITKELLDPVTTTLKDVQNHLLEIITPSTILLGQSLNSDLNALRLAHPFIIDTSCIFHHSRGPPYKASLKWLTQRYLKRSIQSTAIEGHDSIEDARACLDLLKLKLEKGPQFGTAEESRESIFKRLARPPHSRKTAIVDYGDPAKHHPHATVALAASTDDEVVKHFSTVANGDELAGISKVDFCWARLRELETARGFIPPSGQKQDLSVPIPPIAPDPPKKVLAQKVEETVKRLREMYDSLPKCSAFVVYSGTGDPRRWRRLEEVQKRFKEEYKVKKWDELSVKWTDTEDQALRKEFAVARGGVGFIVVK
jgi:RNA exonuclease 1